MKIRVLSDLHLEVAGWRPPPCDEDVVVLAGDIHEGRAGIAWRASTFATSRRSTFLGTTNTTVGTSKSYARGCARARSRMVSTCWTATKS